MVSLSMHVWLVLTHLGHLCMTSHDVYDYAVVVALDIRASLQATVEMG